MTNLDDLISAMEGCTHVIHNAHPNPFLKRKGGYTEENMLIPTIRAMENILIACELRKIKRLIVTLCIVNLIGNLFKHKKGEKKSIVYSHLDLAPE